MSKAFSCILTLCAALALVFIPEMASADVYAEYEVPGTRSAYRTDPEVNSRRTDHFLIRFGPKPREGFMTEQLFQGQLQFMEHVYDTWKILGLRGLGGTDPNIKYKGIIQPRQTWDGDTPGTAVAFGEGPGISGIHVPGNSLGYKAPNGCTPHEFGHGWQNQGGLPACQPPGLTESLANWVMQLHLAAYPLDWITVGIPMGHAAASYNCMSIFNYFMEAPGYGSEFINKLIFDPNLNAWNNYAPDDIIRKAIRVDTSGAVDKAGAIRDGLGMMNAKMLNMDFWNHRVNQAYTYDQDTTWSGYQFNRIPMVRQPGVSGVWYRPEWTCIPQMLSNNYIPLTVISTSSPRRVTCDFRPVADAVRGTSFRACFVAFNQNKEPRYGRVWNAGINSFVLADDETAVYLAIIACPKELNTFLVHNDYTTDNVAMFPYRISLTGATPKGWQWAAPTSGFHTHTNGGGKVANTATVDASAYVGPNAMVLGSAKVYGNSRIEDYAMVDGSAVIGRLGQSDNPVISGHAYVTGTAQVYGHAKVRDYGWVWGAARIYDNAIVMAHTMVNGATVYGNAVLNQAPLRDTGLNYNGTYSGSAIVGGDCSSLGVMFCDKGVWCEFPAISVADNKYQYLGYNFEKKSCVFAMDQYGMNHSYLINEPQVVRDTVNGVATTVLNLDGVSQYVELRPDAVDFADITISAWVKWTGSDSEQKIFSTGDGSTQYMYLTPKDATTGKLRFVISNRSTTQYLDGTAPLTANTWTHVAVTLSGNTGTLYVNGAAVDTDTSITIDPDQLHAPLMENWNFIGRGNTGNYFAGRIDEFRVYNKALSASEIAAVRNEVATSTAPATDTAAPTPNAATWLVNPTAAGEKAITMSATEGTDAGGNGVLYYFRCIEDPTHDSGWISENKYTACNCLPGWTYTFAVRMKDKLGNLGAESSPLSATAASADNTPPTPNPPTFAVGPRGTSTSSITMVATTGTDSAELVMYKFSRVGGTATSGWTSSRTWTDTGLTSGASYSYTLQMKDSHGNTTSVTTSGAAVARDDTPPTLDADFRMQWETYPYTQLDGTVRMYARKQAETAVDYYYECIQNPAINSGWTSNIVWVTPPMPVGTYSFRFKIRDRSPQLNASGWSEPKSAKVTTTNTYGNYALAQLSGLPDSTLVRFTGKVTEVNPTNYTVSTSDGLTSIKVVPRTFGYQADATLLNRNVNVKGHLWTYSGSPKCVTGAIVAGSPQTGKIEFENCEYDDDLARLLYDPKASGSEYLGWYQSGWSITIPDVAAATQISVAYAGGGRISLYLNGVDYRDITLPNTANGSTWGTATVTGLNIPAGATLRIQQDPGDSSPNLDYMIIGPAYTLSGKVTNTSGTAIAGAKVDISGAPGATLNPTYTTVTDANGNYSKTVPNGTWYVAASAPAQCYITSSDQTVVINGANRSNINFALEAILMELPRENDLLCAFVTDMLPDNPSAPWTWSSYRPIGMVLTSNGVPSTETLGGQRWEKNSYSTGDSLSSVEYSSAIPVEGASIVVAIKPTRNTISQPWPSTVNVFFNRLSLGVANDTGRVLVKRNNSHDWANASIPDGQMTILSLVCQPTGEYKVWANGTQIMNITSTSDMTSLVPGVPGGYAKRISIGSNGPDGWSAFNGYIGDVAIYKVALTDAERVALEATMSAKFGIQQYAITASAGPGGTISPSGALVSAGTSQTFTITPDPGYGVSQVLVDGVDQGPILSYTFTNVLANHAISATFAAMPPRTITASAGPNGSISPSGSVAVNYNGSQTFTITAASGYTVAQVLVDGVNVGATGSYTFENVTTDRTISATFVPYTGPTPVAFYQFENNVLDAMNTFNGTAYNSPTYVTGKIGAKAIQLNGSNQYATIPKSVSTNFTIAFWVKTTQASLTGSQWYNGRGLVDGEVGGATSDFGISYLNSKVAFGAGNPDTTIQSNSNINTGEWVHVACTRDNTTGQMRIYINGVLEKTGTGPTGTRAAPSKLHVGSIQTGTNYFNGTIDQLKMFSSVLSASDVAALANEGTVYTITSTVGANGSVNPAGTVGVNHGASQTFTFAPNAGYGIATMTVDGASITPVTCYTFSNVTDNHTISATFARVLGTNNKAALTDGKLVGRPVKVWGKIKAVNDTTSFAISDGYKSDLTILINDAALPTGFGTGRMVAVTGLLASDRSIQAQMITVYP